MADLRQGIHSNYGIPPPRLRLPASSYAVVDVEREWLDDSYILHCNLWGQRVNAKSSSLQATRPLHCPQLLPYGHQCYLISTVSRAIDPDRLQPWYLLRHLRRQGRMDAAFGYSLLRMRNWIRVERIAIANVLQLNYLTKYLELIDTVFLVLKKKPLSMQCACLSTTSANSVKHSSTATTTVPLPSSATPNSLVLHLSHGSQLHSTSWFTFSCTGTTSRARVASESGGRNGSPLLKLCSLSLTLVYPLPSSPKDATSNGIISLGFVYFASYTYFTSTYFQWMPNAGKCAGEEFAAFSGMGILTSYLLLFISFYIVTYKKEGKKPTGRKASRSISSLRDMKDAPLPDVAALTHGAIHSGHKSEKNGHAVTTGTSPSRPVTRSRKA